MKVFKTEKQFWYWHLTLIKLSIMFLFIIQINRFTGYTGKKEEKRSLLHMESNCLLSLLIEQWTHFKSNKRDKTETYISGVQISDMTLNNVALLIALSGAEIMVLHWTMRKET